MGWRKEAGRVDVYNVTVVRVSSINGFPSNGHIGVIGVTGGEEVGDNMRSVSIQLPDGLVS